MGRERRVKTRYNVPPEVHRALLRETDGKCWICRRYKANSLDHDHRCCSGPTSCGKCARGLLCRNCNKMLGHARDDAETFLRAAAYLAKPPAQRLRLATSEGTLVHPPVPAVD